MTKADAFVSQVPNYLDANMIQAAVVRAIGQNPSIFESLPSHPLVVVKPNWIQESHEHRANVWEPVISHPDVVLAVVEVLAEQIGGRGTICLCDAPHTYAKFDAIIARGELRERFESLRSRWPQLSLELIDLRRDVWIRKDEVVVSRRPNTEDPRGYVRVDLGRDSLFYHHGGEGRYYGADYDAGELNSHHGGELHEYLLAGTPMSCDLFVNIPKLKTHKKTGITCCLKNLVGINGDKNWLPHHTMGNPRTGGDEMPSSGIAQTTEQYLKRWGQRAAISIPILGTWAYRKMRRAGKLVLGDSEQVVRNGNWHGNDTCWRMALDLNRALLYANRDGTFREVTGRKNYLAIVDGIIGGEGNGPLCPDPVQSGVLISGSDPAAVDAAACRLMGFDPDRIPIVAHAFDDHRWPIATSSLDKIVVQSEDGNNIPLSEMRPAVPNGFKPHFGWDGLLRTGESVVET